MNSLENQQDNLLLNQIREQGDPKSIESLYRRYQSRLGSFLYRMVKNAAFVDEIYNDVMMVVWKNSGQFDGSSKVSTWIYAIAYRTCLKCLAKEKNHQSRDETLKQDNNSELSVGAEQDDQQRIINKALKQLSFEHRTVIELAYFVGNNYAEIAAITDTSESTVKTRIFYARKNLQLALKNLDITSAATN